MTTRRQSQKQQTREKIRTAARALFVEQGYEATTSRQIASGAAVAVGTLFVHFEGKHAILADILFEDIEATVAEGFRTLPADGSCHARLTHLVQALYSYYVGQIELSRVLLQQNLFAPAGDDNFEPQLTAFSNAVGAIIAQGQKAGDVTSTQPAERLAQLFMAIYFYGLMGLIRQGADSFPQVTAQFEEMLAGILS